MNSHQIDPRNFLHLVAVLFMGTEPDQSADEHPVDQATMQACFENHTLLSRSSFTQRAMGHGNADNLRTFKEMLADAGRDEAYIDLAVRVLHRFDRDWALRKVSGRAGPRTIDMVGIIDDLTQEGWDDGRLDLLEQSSTLRDGLRAYAKLCLNLEMPENMFDTTNEP